MERARRILILTADAGYGHRAAANAIAAALAQTYGDACQVSVSNPLNDPRTPLLLRKTQDDYDRMVREAPELYQLTYQLSDLALPVGIADATLIASLFVVLRDLIQRTQPDCIISTHPYYQSALRAVFALGQQYIPLLVVVTDFATVHSLWFESDVDLFMVPTDVVAAKAVQSGVPSDHVEITGLPVDPAFAEPFDKAAMRQQLGWDTGPYMALMIGSKRVQRLESVADVLNHSGLPLELALVSGGDEELRCRLETIEWHLPAHIYGFVDNMPDMIRASDLALTKAGGLITAECLAGGVPVAIIEAIQGQETGNVEYVVERGAGEFVPDPVSALRCLCHWLEHGGRLLTERAANAKRSGKPDAALRVADRAWQWAHQEIKPRPHPFLDNIAALRQLLNL